MSAAIIIGLIGCATIAIAAIVHTLTPARVKAWVGRGFDWAGM